MSSPIPAPVDRPLVFVERGVDGPTRGSLGLLAVARSLAGSAAAVVSGPGALHSVDLLKAYGADVIHLAEDAWLAPDLGQPQVDVLGHLVTAHDYRTILFEHSGVTSDAASGLAARLDAGLNWDLQGLAVRDGELIGDRLALEDTIVVHVGWSSAVRLAVFRIGVNDPVPVDGAGRVERFESSFEPPALLAQVVERRPASAAIDLSTADIIVAGGRGLRDRASLALIEDLADALGAAVAVSMPLVDRGWASHSRQVGQTGQKVRPRLYLACGISGQLGHRVGMEKSGLIVAINSDPTAPIFGISDAGVVGDLHNVVPELTRAIREARRAAVDPT